MNEEREILRTLVKLYKAFAILFGIWVAVMGIIGFLILRDMTVITTCHDKGGDYINGYCYVYNIRLDQ
jgi:hypothetical protein